jgi:hypothetical protein
LRFETGSIASKWTWRRVGFRRPKKGEYYVSGAIPEAYRAPNDLPTEYLVVERLVEHKLKQVWLPA